jgi:hypothetical protein
MVVFVVGGILGGGPTSPNLSLFTEALACILFAAALAETINNGWQRGTGPALVLLALICLVPLVQLLPLPPDYWRALPGRSVAQAIANLAGLGDRARPISLAPEETRLAALSLIVPASVFIATTQLGPRSRDEIMIVIVGFALVSALLGMFQVAAGGGLNLDIYRQTSEGYPNGFFANRNHEADLLLIAIPLSTHLIRLQPWPRRNRAVALTLAILFFSVSVIATQSRTAFGLLPLALAGSLVIWIGSPWDRRVWIGAGGLLAATVVGYTAIRLTPVGHHLIGRFSTVGDDLRPAFWQGTWSAIRDFWPIGSGVGSFVPIYKMFEDLNTINDTWVNHAHNDYLEVLLDTGIAGAILMAGYIIVLLSTLIRHVPTPLRSQRYAALSVIAILLGHSIADYPLRTFGLITIFAFANGLLFPSREAYRIRRSGSHPAVPPPAFAMSRDHA